MTGPARAVWLLLGVVTGLFALLAAGELFVRLAPPEDLQPYLGARSGLAGPYVSDPVLGANYRSWDAFAALYRERLAELGNDNRGRPVWAMFGNSFVQAAGMLGDTAQAALPKRQVFYLRRNEPIYLRVAQFRVLLEHGLRPERAFFVVLPIDLYGIALDPVAALDVTPDGAIGRSVRKPPLIAPLLGHSRLALAAWVRSGRHRLLPGFRGKDVLEPLPALVMQELDGLFGEIARLSETYDVPASIVFIPNREQLFGDRRTVPQDAYRAAADRFGLDFIDSAPALLAAIDHPGLLIPDGHLSDRGNAILLEAIRSHLEHGQPVALGQDDSTRDRILAR
jgi:hypothetical protein